MSSDHPSLPPSYSEIPTATPIEKSTVSPQAINKRIAGAVSTISIKDFDHDYLKIVRETTSSYSICLTVDPTPIYRIEFISDSSKVGNIQIFPAFDTTLPAVAAARLSTNPKPKRGESLATICTNEPSLPESPWRSIVRAPIMTGDDYISSIPIITMPGTAPRPHKFTWRTEEAEPFFELWWEDGPLPLVPKAKFFYDQRDSEYKFATLTRKTATGGENVLEIRRGGGLDFELTVVLEFLVILNYLKKPLL